MPICRDVRPITSNVKQYEFKLIIYFICWTRPFWKIRPLIVWNILRQFFLSACSIQQGIVGFYDEGPYVAPRLTQSTMPLLLTSQLFITSHYAEVRFQ